MTMQIKIKYLDETQTRISKIEQGDWIDLRAAEDVTIKKDEFKLVPLGVAMELPEGYEAHVVPRSSTYKTLALFKQIQWVLSMSHIRETTISGSFPLMHCVILKLRRVIVSASLES